MGCHCHFPWRPQQLGSIRPLVFIPRPKVHSPLALHVGSSSVPVEHGIVRGPLHGLAVKLNGLGPLLAGKGLVGLLFHALQVWGQLYLGTTGKESQVGPAKEGQSSLSGSL